MGTFDTLNIGLSALYAQRRAIDVAGQNIANVNTEGYSRQRAEMVAASSGTQPALFSRYEGSGQGVRSADVLRIRDQFLEGRAHQEHGTQAYLERLQTTMARIELGYAEPSDTGLAAQLGDFWAGWDDVGLKPDDPAARSQLLERAGTLVASIHQLDAGLVSLADSSVEQLRAVVQDANATAGRIAALNGSIRSATQSGLTPNDLMDQRDRLVLQLSASIGATVRPGDDGSVDVYVGAMALVRGTTAEPLDVAVSPGPTPTVSVTWPDAGLRADVGGDARGLIETHSTVVPDQRAALAAVAGQLLADVNAIHVTGFDRYGAAGQPFFVLGASGIEVNAAIAADPGLVAASATAGAVDGSIAQQLAAQTGPDVLYRQSIVTLGVTAQTIDRRVEVQGTIVQQLDQARESEAGVNLDEEMTGLVAFQTAYAAAARFVTTVDELMDDLLRMV